MPPRYEVASVTTVGTTAIAGTAIAGTTSAVSTASVVAFRRDVENGNYRVCGPAHTFCLARAGARKTSSIGSSRGSGPRRRSPSLSFSRHSSRVSDRPQYRHGERYERRLHALADDGEELVAGLAPQVGDVDPANNASV